MPTKHDPSPQYECKCVSCGKSFIHASKRACHCGCDPINPAPARIAELEAENKRLKMAAGFCEEHQPNGGARNCLVCSCFALSSALSRIDYALGESNEMDVSQYDIDHNEERVVQRVVARIAELEAAPEALPDAKGVESCDK